MESVDQIQNQLRQAADLAYRVGGSEQLSYAQARRLMFILDNNISTERFITPITFTLFYDNEDGDRCVEPMYSAPLCDAYLQQINEAIRTLPSTLYEYGGLALEVCDDDPVLSFYLQSHIDRILPSVEVLDGVLTGVFEVACRTPYDYDALNAITGYLEKRCFYDWGDELQQLDIPITDVTLSYDRSNITESGKGIALKNPTVSIHFHSDRINLTREC